MNAKTFMVSFQPRARARILYGYFDGNLKIQLSRVQDFCVPRYNDMMTTLLRWAYPMTCGLTTKSVPMPTISERDEVERVEKHCERLSLHEKLSSLHTVLEECHWRKKLLSLAKARVCTKGRVNTQRAYHECAIWG